MTDNEIRNDFANRLINRLQTMHMDGAALVVELTLDDVNDKVNSDNDDDGETEPDEEDES
jgi:hypothetical protein